MINTMLQSKQERNILSIGYFYLSTVLCSEPLLAGSMYSYDLELHGSSCQESKTF
jgi:hypothetical protein